MKSSQVQVLYAKDRDPKKRRLQSILERRFDLVWRACKGPELQEEVKLIPGRRFRCDFYHEPTRTVIELEGLNGRHQRIAGFITDTEKYLLLTLAGFRVVRLTSKQITVEWIERLVKFVGKQS